MRIVWIVLGMGALIQPGYGITATQPSPTTQTSVAKSYFEQGKKYLEAKRCGEAVDAFKKAIAIVPESGLYNALGRAYDCLDKSAKAEVSFKQAVRLDPDNTGALFNLGCEYANQRKIAEANNILLELKHKDPDSAQELEAKIEQVSLADDLFAKSRKAMAREGEEYLQQGRKYRESGDYLRAIESDKESISVRGSSEAYNELGLSYLALKRNSDAVLAFQKAIQLKPNGAELQYNLASAYFEMGQYEKSKTSVNASLRLNPDDVDVINLLGDIHFRLKEYPQAIAQFQKSTRLKPSSYANNELGLIYLELKQNPNAVTAFQEAIKQQPSDFVLHDNLAKAYLDMGQYEKSKMSVREALRLKPDNPEAINTLGVAELGLKEYEQAVAEFQQAVRLAPDDGRFQHHLGKAYFLMGRKADAQLVYKRLLTLDKVWAQKLYEDMNSSPKQKHN
jgi:tetratricopeptide (TPR) repeat protein